MSEFIKRRGVVLEVQIGEVSLAELERELILATLAFYSGNKNRSARALGISLKTIYNKLEAYACDA